MPKSPWVKIPLLIPKRCPACLGAKEYDLNSGLKAPAGWIHVAIYDADDYVCCEGCMNALIQAATKRREMLEESRKEPILPPHVVI
jgi:hypothetical protein